MRVRIPSRTPTCEIDMKPKPAIVVKPRVKTGRPDLDAMYTAQLIERLRAINANAHYLTGRLFGPLSDDELVELEAERTAIKAVLAHREHIPGKVEAKKIRQDAQRAKQCR